MLLAQLTMQHIDAAIEYDQGASYRGALRTLLPQAEDIYRGDDDPFRSHLGASIIGRKCERELWYSFRWSTRRRFEGRMLRLFNRGHMEEPRMVAMLVAAGVRVWQYDENGKQFRASGHRGHFGGSADGVALGIPEMPEVPVLAEFKTHNDASFNALTTAGVLSSKWTHFVQMQIYMHALRLTWALYCAGNKNDDRVHIELVQYDPGLVGRMHERAASVIEARDPPKRISKNSSWYECKFCDQRQVCHFSAAPERNCRTCVHSVPVDNGAWMCMKYQATIDKPRQLVGCDGYEMHPGFK